MKKIIIKNSDQEIIVPDGSKLIVIEDRRPGKGRAGSSERRRRLIIGQHCQVQHILILRHGVHGGNKESREIILGDYSRLDTYQAYFASDLHPLESNSYLGQGAELNSRVFFYQVGAENLEVQDNYVFQAPGSRGRFSVSGILGDQSRAKYYSDIVIQAPAQGTDSRIDMKLYLADAGAQGTLLPGLKIAANEVKAGHGASTFQLSPEDLFYLRSRGLSPQQAKTLLIDSLSRQFCDGISDEKIKELLYKEVAKKIKYSS